MNNASEDTTPQSLEGILEHLVETTEGEDQITLGELLDSLSSRSHGPMLLLPAIMAISPLGMIPGMSIATGSLIILVAVQIMLFADRPWIPERLARFQFSRDRLKQTVERIKPWIRWFEKAIHRRLDFLACGIMVYPIGLLSIILAATFFPLAVVPLGVLIPGTAIAMLGLGLTAEDGLLVLVAILLAGLAGWMLWSNWPF